MVQDNLDLDDGFSCFGNMDRRATSFISYYKAFQVSVAGKKMATNECSSTLDPFMNFPGYSHFCDF